MNLLNAPIGVMLRVVSVEADERLRFRLNMLKVGEGAVVAVAAVAPLKRGVAVEAEGALIGIRAELAEKIYVEIQSTAHWQSEQRQDNRI